MTAREMKRAAAQSAAAAAGMTQIQLAERMGLTQSYIHKILQGNAPLERVRELVEVCGARLTLTIEH
jgi:transcriptional regulator with XRE-family HTH domain